MGFFAKIKAGLQKTQQKLVHELKRIVTLSPKLSATSLADIETALGTRWAVWVGACRSAWSTACDPR